MARIYVCEESYAESVSPKSSVSLYGGFGCAGFSYNCAKPKVQPTDGASVALDVAASTVTVADLELVGPEQGAPNSIAVRVVDSQAWCS